MFHLWHDYWPMAIVTALTWAVLTCLSGLVAFAVMAVRQPQDFREAVSGFRRMFTKK